MKKRYYFLLMMLVSCFWICGTKISVCAENQSNIEQKDTFLSEFMREDDLPQDIITKDCDINLIYDNGGSSFSSDSMYMIEKYGFGANVYHFEDMQSNSYLYLDIVFSDNAKFGSDDSLLITLPFGVSTKNAKIDARWAQPHFNVEWKAVKDFVISPNSGMTNTIRISLNMITLSEDGNRLLLSIRRKPTDDMADFERTTVVIWQHDPLNNSVNYDVLAPSVTIPGNSTDWKKVAVLVIVLTLDVIVAVAVYLKLKQHPKKTDESNTQMLELSEEDTAVLKEKLQNNLKLDNEDMEYLKSIGYFEPKSNSKK